jgi:hypothetical protein
VRRLLLALTLAATAGLAAAACQRATVEQCERLCWRYNELGFWEAFEAEAARLAPDAREKLRAERVKSWAEMKARKFDPGLENCLRDCRRSASPDDLACVERARTVAEAKRCLGVD